MLSTRTNIILFMLMIAANQARQASSSTYGLNGPVLFEKFRKEQIVGDVIDTKPNDIMSVQYKSDSSSHGIVNGLLMTPTEVKDLPKIHYRAEADKLYTLIMTDPDAPSRKAPTRREFLHFLVVNIPGDDVSKGDVLAEYIGAGPPKGTGPHRYVFLLYKQNGKLVSDMKKITKNSADGRANFSTRNWAKANNLGSPIAANFFLAEYDDYVPVLHAQLRG